MERVVSEEVGIYQFEKFSSDVCFNFCVEWGVKPDNISFCCSFSLVLLVSRSIILHSSLFFEGLFIVWKGFVAFFFITGILR